MVEKLVPDSFFKNQNWIPGSEFSYRLILLYVQVDDYQNIY